MLITREINSRLEIYIFFHYCQNLKQNKKLVFSAKTTSLRVIFLMMQETHMNEVIKEICWEFFRFTWVELEELEITQEKDSLYFIRVKSPDSALLIWNRWQTLHDIKRILSILLSHKLKTKIVAMVEVNNYLEERDQKLFRFIDDKIDLCNTLWKDIKLPFFSAYERKKIHNYISEKWSKTISTKSEWIGAERRLYICKATEKMTIDIDGTEI